MAEPAVSPHGPMGTGPATGERGGAVKEDMASPAPANRGFRWLSSSFRKHPDHKTEKTAMLSLPPDVEIDRQEDSGAQETLIPARGIKPGMGEKWFQSKAYGFRLGVQPDSVPPNLSEAEAAGPIVVSQLKSTMVFEGAEWEGVLKVECLPSGTDFLAPLIFDFPVDAGSENDPIMDAYGRIRYEVLIKDSQSKRWVRDKEGSPPLQVVKDDKGRTYVRAHIRHFSIWGCWKAKELEFGPQLFEEQEIPWGQRKRHQSAIKNITEHDIDIHIFAMRMAQWKAALNTVKMGGGAQGFNAEFEAGLDVNKHISAFGRIPQMVRIPAGHCHWLEIPRVGTGLLSSRKAAVVVATVEDTTEHVGQRMRMEAMVHLRSDTLLKVKLPVKDGKVSGSPAVAESGGILSQVYRLIQNQVNASPGPPASTAAGSRNRSDAASAPMDSGCGSTTGSEAARQQPAGWPSFDPSLMAESKGDDDPALPTADNDAPMPGGRGGGGGGTGRGSATGVEGVAPAVAPFT